VSAFDVKDDVESSYLTEQFLIFQAELVRVKRELAAPPAAGAASQDAPDAPPAAAAADDVANARRPGSVGHGLRGFLEGQGAQAEGLGGRYARQNNDEARYLKAALADEALITLTPWQDSGGWIDHLLEQDLFQSRRAGDRVFDAIDTLLLERIPARREMAMLYLYALAMGFEGRYRDAPGGADILRQRRLELYRYASGHLPDPIFTDAQPGRGVDIGRRLLPQPYQYTLDQGKRQMLPNPRRWIAYFFACAVAFLLATEYFWTRDMSQLHCLLDKGERSQPSNAAAGQDKSCPPPGGAQ